MKIGSLCSGYGGLEEGVRAVLGGEVAWHSEIDAGAVKILNHRYPGVPNLGDMTAVDWSQVEPVDVITGGTPCQDVSAAGKRAGMRAGTRSGLWSSMCDAIDIIRPGLVVWENVRGVLSAGADSDLESGEGRLGDGGDGPVLRALGRVLGDLADIWYDASWQGLRAADVGAPHGRFRVFVTAWPAGHAPGEHEGSEPGGRRETNRGATAGRGEVPEASAVRPQSGRPGATPPHPADDGRERGWPSRLGRDGSADHGDAAADADRHGWPGRAEADRPERADGSGSRRAAPRPGSDAAADAHLEGLEGTESAAGHLVPAWGPYAAAIRRWERLTRPAPSPVEPGKNGRPRLSAHFVEWMQGLPAGWVTDVPGLTRNEQLKALGNGVVPQQAAQALRMLLPDLEVRAA